MCAILEGDTVVTFDDQQQCHHLTPIPKKGLSYLMSQDKQSITVTSCAHAPVASQEHSRMTSCVSALVRVAGNARVDRDNLDDKQSITITSGVSVHVRVASGEQDHVSSGLSALSCVAGDAGRAYKMLSLARPLGLRMWLWESKATCLLAYPHLWLRAGHTLVWLELWGGAYEHLEFWDAIRRAYDGRSGICKVIAPRNIDLYGVSYKVDFYTSLWDLYSYMFPSKFTSTCLLPAEHAELGQMLGTGSDGVFPYCNVTLEQDVVSDVTLEVPRRYGSSRAPRNDSGFSSCNQGVTLEQEVPGREDSSISPNVELQPGLKSPSSLSAWLSNMPTPQRDVYISAIWPDPKNI
jgi:hypothetical protein